MRFAGTVALAALCPVTAAAAAGAPAEDPPAIVVTAARTTLPISALPLTATVLDRATLDRQVQISGSIVDAVSALIPSFSPSRQKLTGQGETLRGRSPLYAIDGIPQTAPLRDGSRDGFTIDPFFVDRVEVIFGSNALQGIGATGGVINQLTVSAPAGEGWSLRTLAQGTAENRFRSDGFGLRLGALPAVRAGAFDAVVGVAYEERGAFRDADGRRLGVEPTQGDLMNARSIAAFAKFGVDLGRGYRLEAMAQAFDLKGGGDLVLVPGNRTLGIPASSEPGMPPGQAPRNQAETLALTLTGDDLQGGTLRARAFWNRTRDIYGGGIFADFQDPRIAPRGTLFDQSQNRSRKWGGNLTYERTMPGIEDLRLLIGLDLLNDATVQKLIATDRAWVPPTDYRSIAPFAQANLALLEGRVKLSGGLRHEAVRITIPDYETLWFYGPRKVAGGAPTFREWLPNGGLVIEPVPGVRGYVSYAEGYTVPDIGRITRAIRQDNVRIGEFLDIQPVISNNRELGVEVRRGPVDASASYFWSSSDRGELLMLVGDVFEVQRQRVEIEGLELAVRAAPVDWLVLGLAYSHLSGRVDTTGDGRVDRDLDGANIAPDRLNLSIDLERGRVSGRILWAHYLSRTFAGGDPRANFGGYELVDAWFGLDTGAGTVSLAVHNLTNNQYISYNSQTVRPTDNLRFFAGRGRAVTLGWQHNFR